MQPDQTQGQRIGRYEIKAMLGRGGMATVYRAHDTALRRDVALKVLYPQFGSDDTLIERFQREAVLAAGLDHPNIVPIYDVGEAAGAVYIAMKLLDGRSLADLLRVQPRLAPATLVPIIDQIAAALDYAHRRGIVHRDIKTANIMLEGPDTGPFHAMLTDFGIAKSLDSSGMTTTGVLIGTPDYMAPEQISQAVVDGRVDIYALGVVAFRCLTGRRPFEGGTEQVLIGHLQGAVPDASLIEPSLPPVIDPVIRKALAKRPEQRYTSAGEFARVLRAALGFETLTPPSALRRDADARAVVPSIAADRMVRAQAADAPTQRSATNAPTQRAASNAPTQRAPAPVAPPRPSQPPRRSPSAGGNIGPMIAIALLVVALGGLTFALYRTFAASNSGSNGELLPVPLIPTAQLVPTRAPDPTVAVPPTDAPPPPTPQPAPEPSAAPPAPPTSAPTTTEPSPSAAPPTQAPPTVAPPTAIPPIVAPPTVVPSTAIPPTAVPPTDIPPTAVPPTAAPVACVIKPTNGFGTIVQSNPSVGARIGCPTQNEVASNVTEQAFQRGAMLWYVYQGGEMFYVLQGSSSAEIKGTWTRFTKDQVDAVKNQTPPAIDPPPNNAIYIPRAGSGFYYIWVYNDVVRSALGYALKLNEDTFEGAAFQAYDGGMMLFTPNGFGLGATIYVLYNDGSFERYRDVSTTAPN